jgi:hypothetical protein
LEIYYLSIGNENITGTLSIGNVVHVSSKGYRSIIRRKALPALDYLAYLSLLAIPGMFGSKMSIDQLRTSIQKVHLCNKCLAKEDNVLFNRSLFYKNNTFSRILPFHFL